MNIDPGTTSSSITISYAVDIYLENITSARSANTAHTYRFALRSFLDLLSDHQIDVKNTPVIELREDSIAWFAAWLKDYSPATEQLYLTAAAGFFEFLAAERLASPNLPRMRLLIHQRSRRPGLRLPQFAKDQIEIVLDYVNNITIADSDNQELLRALRDRAFLITLADTGLRVHEACNLRRGDLDWNEGKAIIIGKGDRQAVIRFSRRSIQAIQDYLKARSPLDSSTGRPLSSLPLFARHDRGAGSKVKKITTTTGRNIVAQRVSEALGSQSDGTITPHSFRHYFVTKILKGSHNLKLAQELARHRNIGVTQRYAHLSDDELDEGYVDIFE